MAELAADSSELVWLDQEVIDRLKPEVDQWLADAAALFENPPEIHTIHWLGAEESLISPIDGVGGFSYAPGELSLAWDEDFKGDKDVQKLYFHDTVLHEFFHQVQEYHGKMGALGPLAVAIYEGAATVFARNTLGTHDRYAYYTKVEPFIPVILDEIKDVTADQEWDWKVWKWQHPKYGWDTLYKVGVHIVDKALKNKPDWKIEDLARMPWEDIVMAANVIEEK